MGSIRGYYLVISSCLPTGYELVKLYIAPNIIIDLTQNCKEHAYKNRNNHALYIKY